MGQGNVPISLLLDGNGKDQSKPSSPPSIVQDTTPAQSIVAQYQSPIIAEGSSHSPEAGLAVEPVKPGPRAIAPARRAKATPNADTNSGQLLDQLKSFQTNFRAASKKAPKIVFKPPKTSRASITSIINVDDNSNMPSSTPPPPEKKRRATKAEGTAKKAKTEKKPTKAELKAAELKATELKAADLKVKEYKRANGKTKSPEAKTTATEKPGIYATITAEKRKWGQAPPTVGDASILEGEGSLRLMGRDDADPAKSDAQLPVVVLDIPLLDAKDPKPGQAEVVVHVMKMAEEKYGWNAVHPNSKSAIDLLDEMLEDEEEGEEDEDDDVVTVDEKGTPLKKKEETTKEKKKKKEPKVNRKVGKYDCDDPFIDDTELQWEEEITTTKEGFFVYWGPLVDERSTGTTRKNASKNKKQ